MSNTGSAGACERCRGPLYGSLGVFGGEFCGVPVIAIREVSPRNWICCDACARMLCRACCRRPESGYCNDCLSRTTSAATGG